MQVRGILMALRYLSREAEGAGLKELAKTLEEAESKCDRGTNITQELSQDFVGRPNGLPRRHPGEAKPCPGS